QVNYDRVAAVMRNFVGFITGDGVTRKTTQDWYNSLSSDWERETAHDMQGYLRLFAKNVAEGTIRSTEESIKSYCNAYLNIRDGIEVSQSFQLDIDYDFTSTQQVKLGRADLPPEAWAYLEKHNLIGSGKEGSGVSAGVLARMAYDAAVRGDLRLVQHLVLVP